MYHYVCLRDIWSKTVVFSGSAGKKYRYFVGRLLQSENEDEELSVIVTKWETNIRPRTFSVTGISLFLTFTNQALVFT